MKVGLLANLAMGKESDDSIQWLLEQGTKACTVYDEEQLISLGSGGWEV